jgi:hypothetical protein
MLGNYQVAAQLVSSQVVLSSTELVSHNSELKCTAREPKMQISITLTLISYDLTNTANPQYNDSVGGGVFIFVL